MDLSFMLRRYAQGIGLVMCVLLTSIAAAASTQWTEIRQNFYGYGGDYAEFVRVQLANSQDFFAGDRAPASFPLAVPGSYVLSNNQGVVNVFSSDRVFDSFDFAYICTHVNPARPPVSCAISTISESYPGSFKFRHTFIATEAFVICDTLTISAGLTPGTLRQDGTVVGTSDVNIGCQDGSLPLYGQGQFMHGVK